MSQGVEVPAAVSACLPTFQPYYMSSDTSRYKHTQVHQIIKCKQTCAYRKGYDFFLYAYIDTLQVAIYCSYIFIYQLKEI